MMRTSVISHCSVRNHISRYTTVAARRYYSTKCLVIAEHNNKTLHPCSLTVISAASQISKNSVDVLIAGNQCQEVAKQAAQYEGVSKVIHADHSILERPLPEAVVPVIEDIVKKQGYTHVLASSTSTGKNILPRLAGVMNLSSISDITQVVDSDTFVRPIYAGNALSTVKSKEAVKIITVRATAFDKVKESSSKAATIESVSASVDSELAAKSQFKSANEKVSERPDLTSANVVVSGGRGMKSQENFKLLEELADSLNGAVGASRAAVDAGFAPNDMQVGQTGKVVAPELYIAVGISGAIQHLAGMKDTKLIVAINKDGDAPFFQVADVGLVQDLFTAVPQLTEAIKKAKSQ